MILRKSDILLKKVAGIDSILYLCVRKHTFYKMEIITSPVDVARTVQNDLESQGYKLAAVARKMGKSPQNFYNMLSGKCRFSKKTAQMLHDEFGYSISFLTEGRGNLRDYEEDIPLGPSSYPQVVIGNSNQTPREKLFNDYLTAYIKIYTTIDDITSNISRRTPFQEDISTTVRNSNEFMNALKESGYVPMNKTEELQMSQLLMAYESILAVLSPIHLVNDLSHLEKDE